MNNKKHFLKEFNLLIEKEKESNKSVKAEITGKKGNILNVSTKYPSDLTKNMSVEVNRIPATVTDINSKNMTIRLKKESSLLVGDKVSIQNIQKNIIIQKLQEAYDNIRYDKINKDNGMVLESIVNLKKPEYTDRKIKVSSKLNENQQIAVKKSLQSNLFHMIQGPPGTGKTHTIVEIIKQLYNDDKRILITTHTHIALDNIIERLDMINDDDILRIGQMHKVTPNALRYTLDEQIRKHPSYGEIVEREKRIEELQNVDSCQSISDGKSGGAFIGRIFRHIFSIEENENSLNNYVGEVNKSKNIERINEIKLEIDTIKNNIQSDICHKAKIIASTVLSSSSFLTKDLEFDYVIMDEASQVPLYLALIPLMKTSKFILIGDNRQLQPIQNSNSSLMLNKSVFNLFIDKYPENYTFLNIQYRMNHKISDIASKLYYDGRLLTGENVRTQRICLEDNGMFLLDDNPITFIDTSNVDYDESDVGGGCCNRHEAGLICVLVRSLISNGISPDEIGVITPYRKQKLYVQKVFSREDIDVECDTIYRFQGREKDVIILSFCKSMNRALSSFQIRFLANENQLNVSITRSRKKLIIIGNYDMLSAADNIRNLIGEISPLDRIFLEDLI